MNRSSSGNIIADLMAAGFVREVYQDDRPKRIGQGRAGRPGTLLELVPDAMFFLGAEIGAEHITAVEVDLAANIVRSATEALDVTAIPAGEAIAAVVRLAFRDIPAERLGALGGFGLTGPGQIDAAGRVRTAPALGWKDVDLTRLTEAALPVKVPVLAENDANAFAIGATYSQTRAQSGVTVFLVVDSGVGGGIAVDGRLFRGGRGLAGEVGELRMPGPDGGSLEQAIGLGHTLARYRSSTRREDLALQDFLTDVRDRAPRAITIADDWAQALAFAVVQIACVIDPDRIVLGGAMAQLYPLVAARVAAHIRDLRGENPSTPEIVLNEDAAHGSAFGAACLMHQRFFLLENERLEKVRDPAEPESRAEAFFDHRIDNML